MEIAKLDDYQEASATSSAKHIVCLAGAGGGKTRTLLGRIDYLISLGVLPSTILAFTFTRVAAAEMRERYEKEHPGELIPEFRTFHSFCYSLLCKDSAIRNALGYTKIPDIASEDREKEITERAKVQCKITLTNEKLHSRQDLTRKEQWQVELYDKAVARLMKQENLITFDVLNSEVSQLFAADHPSTHYYKQHYQYILVDETQDLDEFQIAFLKSFINSNLYLTGDALQSIYQFRGCTNEFIKQISTSPDWTVYKLKNNYRSTRQICEYANTFSATYADNSYRIEMHSDREGAEVVDTITEEPSNYDAIAVESIKEMITDIADLSGTSAILCRSNKEVDEIHQYLKAKNIVHTTNHETKALKYVECALSDTYMLGYLASFLTPAKYGEYIRLTSGKHADVKWFISTYGDNKKIAEAGKKIMQIRDIATLLIPAADKIRELKKIIKINIPISEEDLFGVEFLRYIKENTEEEKSNELYVGTIHSVKGLEFDNVCVANVNSYCFKLGTEEMNNLFYVAITRAKNRLFVYRIF
jgi:DNA helicase-2/ATP-dependent DNA helicase PcrA